MEFEGIAPCALHGLMIDSVFRLNTGQLGDADGHRSLVEEASGYEQADN